MPGAPLISTWTVPVYQSFTCGPVATAMMSPVGSSGSTDSMNALLLVTATLPELSTAWMNHSTALPSSGPAPLQRGELCDISIVFQRPLASLYSARTRLTPLAPPTLSVTSTAKPTVSPAIVASTGPKLEGVKSVAPGGVKKTLPESAVKRLWVPIPSASECRRSGTVRVKSASRWRGPFGVEDRGDRLQLRRIADVADELGREGREVVDDPAEGCIEIALVGRGEAGDQRAVGDEPRLRDVELRRRLDRAAVLGERVVGDVVVADRGRDPGEARGDVEAATSAARSPSRSS